MRKIAYLYALHASTPLYKNHQETLGGLIDIVEGLEYHFKKINNYEKAACRRLLQLEKEIDTSGKPFKMLQPDLRRTNHWPAKHEAVAYINRLGQLAFFFRSKWFKKVVYEEGHIASSIPSILALMPIRNKFTAHRQQDYSRKSDDCLNLGLHQYGLKHALVGPIGKPEAVRIEYQFPTKQRNDLLEKYHSAPVQDIECFGDSNNLIIFTPTKIHPKILRETIKLMESFFDFVGSRAPIK